jgi:hypothetical protein
MTTIYHDGEPTTAAQLLSDNAEAPLEIAQALVHLLSGDKRTIYLGGGAAPITTLSMDEPLPRDVVLHLHTVDAITPLSVGDLLDRGELAAALDLSPENPEHREHMEDLVRLTLAGDLWTGPRLDSPFLRLHGAMVQEDST